MKESFKDKVLGALPEQGFALSLAKVEALKAALQRLNLAHDQTVMQQVSELARVLAQEEEASAPARAMLRSLIDRVEMGHETSLSVLRFTKF
jgi:hypothetical protein